MKSTAENNNQAAMSGVIAMTPINLLMVSHLSTEAPLFNTANFTTFLCGVIASTICGLISSKIVQRFAEKGRTNALIIGASIGSAIGVSIFALLTEVVKQLQQ